MVQLTSYELGITQTITFSGQKLHTYTSAVHDAASMGGLGEGVLWRRTRRQTGLTYWPHFLH